MATFVLVSIRVPVLRRTQPTLRRAFRVPFVSVLPILSALLALVLIVSLPKLTILRFIVWLAIGLVISFLYSRRRSGLKALDVETRREERKQEHPAGAAPTL